MIWTPTRSGVVLPGQVACEVGLLKNVFIHMWQIYKGCCYDISTYTYIVPRFGSSPPLFSFLPHSPSWNHFNRFQCFIYVQKLPHPPLPSSLPNPPHLCYYSHPCVLVSVHCSVGFALVFYLQIYCTLIRQTPSITHPYLFPPTLYCSAVCHAFCCVLFLQRHDVFQYYSLAIILFVFSSFLSLL
jgi:hypothetical protein